jgi:cell division protein FtsW (lipid II flippase)
MSRTYTSASARDLEKNTSAALRPRIGHGLLALTAIVAFGIVALAYAGRLATLDLSRDPAHSPKVVNLSTVSAPAELDPILSVAFANPEDRRLAAQGLFDFIVSRRNAEQVLPNVGILSSATVSVEAIDKSHGVEYRERLLQAREAQKPGKPSLSHLPLLTASDIAEVKSSFVVRTRDSYRRLILLWGGLYFVSFWAIALLWLLRGVRGDCLLLAAAHLLTAIGFAALISRPDPLRDTVLFVRYVQGILAGLGIFGVVSLLNFRKASFLKLSYVPLLGALVLSLILIIFGAGPGGSNAKVNLGPVQPVEAIRLLLAFFLAGYFARRWELLRQIDESFVRLPGAPRWLRVPRLNYVLPVLTGVAISLLAFFLQKDLGPALFVACVFLAVYAVARNRVGMAAAGMALLVLGFYAGHALNISTTLGARVQMWLSPWDNTVRGGDQIAHSVWSLATGGLFGTGLGLGDTRYLPAGHTDLIATSIGEELGFIGVFLIAVIYTVIAAHGFRVARRAGSDYGFFLATTVTLFLVIPVLIMVAGSLNVIPLTGVVTPFLSYGGSAMLANFAGLGILAAIRTQPERTAGAEPFIKPLRRLQTGLAVAALGLVAILLRTQVISANDLVARPHLSLQADGGRRYQYNQRLLDVARLIPRGTIFDRTGLPLATNTAGAAKAREQYKAARLPFDLTCGESSERCYPLGGVAFHLLGDARTRTNWSASNTSYIERDVEDRLRGFDDHAVVVPSTDAEGNPMRVIRRDYSELIPLLRHRHQPAHPVWRKALGRRRDIKLTIDARLQARVAKILAAHAEKSAGGRAAAVVLDPESGALLAAVSYPFPALPLRAGGRVSNENHAMLDRARYGLYPPGSTFKLVTAAAALRKDMSLSRTTFTCDGLPNGRVGTRLKGWGIIRDDILDTHAHGTIDMHEGLVHSCNAYFAQLAVRLGPQALLDTAVRLGISVAPSNSIEALRKTLPQAAYGQGYVVTSPLRMARVAAAVANNGMYPELRIGNYADEEIPAERIMTPDAAALLGKYMRDAVTSGTGRSLRNHPWTIAGKTGTAEVKGSKSHSWFVGYAPHGGSKKRIAFAVLIESAGYGGSAAAPAAAQIVSAAAESGLID